MSDELEHRHASTTVIGTLKDQSNQAEGSAGAAGKRPRTARLPARPVAALPQSAGSGTGDRSTATPPDLSWMGLFGVELGHEVARNDNELAGVANDDQPLVRSQAVAQQVQRAAAGPSDPSHDMQRGAARGVAGPGSTLPLAEAIQRSFGPSDGAASANVPLPGLSWRALFGVDLADTDPTGPSAGGRAAVDTPAATAEDTELEAADDATGEGGDDSDGDDPDGDGDDASDDQAGRDATTGANASDAEPDRVQASGEVVEHHGSNARTLGDEPATREPEGAQTSSKRRRSSRPPTDSYAIQLRTWIPQKHVADPEKRFRASSWLQTVQDYFMKYPGLRYSFDSKYRGDGHVGLNGTYRVLSRVEFRSDGKRIYDFAHSGDAGTSHRDYSYELYLRLPFGIRLTILKDEHTDSETASGNWRGSQIGASGFRMSYAVADPLTMFPAPPVNADVRASVSRGGLTLNYDTDRFPSHGIIVFKNGRRIRAQIINNVSGQKTSGPLGIANMARGLTSQTNEGKLRSR